MGSSQSAPELGGFRIFKVNAGSPAYEAGLEVFFDFIVEIGGSKMDSDQQQFFQKIREAENTRTKLVVYNIRTGTYRDVFVTPRAWGGAGLLGAVVRYDVLDNTENQGIRVLEVFDKSPARQAGLVPLKDYLLGTTEVMFNDLDELVEIVKAFLNKKMQVYVYNSDTEAIREVTIVPQSGWGGEGYLGADIRTGLLHRIPAPRRQFSHASQGPPVTIAGAAPQVGVQPVPEAVAHATGADAAVPAAAATAPASATESAAAPVAPAPAEGEVAAAAPTLSVVPPAPAAAAGDGVQPQPAMVPRLPLPGVGAEATPLGAAPVEVAATVQLVPPVSSSPDLVAGGPGSQATSLPVTLPGLAPSASEASLQTPQPPTPCPSPQEPPVLSPHGSRNQALVKEAAAMLAAYGDASPQPRGPLAFDGEATPLRASGGLAPTTPAVPPCSPMPLLEADVSFEAMTPGAKVTTMHIPAAIPTQPAVGSIALPETPGAAPDGEPLAPGVVYPMSVPPPQYPQGIPD